MAWTPPGPGALKQRVDFLRRPLLDHGGETGPGDGAGNYEGAFILVCSRSVKMGPKTGGQEIIAGRLQGVDSWELVVRSCVATRTLLPGDMVRDARDTRQTFIIRSALDLGGRGRWIVMALERGVAN